MHEEASVPWSQVSKPLIGEPLRYCNSVVLRSPVWSAFGAKSDRHDAYLGPNHADCQNLGVRGFVSSSMPMHQVSVLHYEPP